jgi:T5SS/PEP-CTERM-associated repeat protein
VKAILKEAYSVRIIVLGMYFMFLGCAVEAQNLALQFDGVQNYVSVPASTQFAPQGKFTFEFWEKGMTDYGDFVNQYNNWYSYLYDGGLYFGLNFQSKGWVYLSTSSSGDSAWHHLAVVYDGTNAIFYLDGIASASNTVGVDNLQNSNLPLYFSRGSDANSYGNETLDDVRISNVARYTNNFAPAAGFLVDSNTVAYWSLTSDTGTIAFDETGNYNGTLVGSPLPSWVAGVPEPSGPTNSWTNVASGKWEDATNWSSGFVPFTNNVADLITNAGGETVTIDATTVLSNALNGCMTTSNLIVSTPNSATNTLLLNGAGLVTPLSVLDTLDVDTNGALVVNSSVVQVSGDLFVGEYGYNGALTIANGGAVYNDNGAIAGSFGSDGNVVTVSGSGSVWSNSGTLSIGHYATTRNSLTISNGGAVFDGGGSMQDESSSVLVIGAGSVWNNNGDLIVGPINDDGNSIIIADGGAVYDNNGYLFGGSGNSMLVTGTGSVWSNQNDLMMASDNGDSLIISNGGVVYSSGGLLDSDQNDLALVTGTGSVWSISGSLEISGFYNNSLIISNGGRVYSESGRMGNDGYSVALLTGAGSVWQIDNDLTIVGPVTTRGFLTIADDGVVLAGSVSSDYMITVSGGGLYVTNGLGTGVLAVNSGTMTINGGTVTANQLQMVIPTGSSSFAFMSGLLTSDGTVVSNGQNFVVGDGTNGAVFELAGGVHSFANGLTVSSNALLTGCGTIEGSVVVDPGGTVLANCGGTLAFTGVVTNNGNITAVNNTSIDFYGPVVNNGVIDSTAGNVQFFAGVQNNGEILPRSQITAISREGTNIFVTWTTVGGHSYVLQNTKSTAMIAEYNTNFADASPIIVASGTGLSETNYLDLGVAYAPILPVPGRTMVTTSTVESTVECSANYTRGIADSLGNALPVGSLLMLGTFSISEPTIQSNFTAGNVSAIMSNFTPYGTSFPVGDGTGFPASWDISLSAAGFAGQQIYLLAIDKPTFAAATHLGIFTAPSWVFPTGEGTNTIDLADVTDFVIGAQGGSLTIGLPFEGATYTFTDTARLSVLPGRILFYRVRLVQ